MASSHMRMRFQSPMLTTSDTAPMVQKFVLLPTEPKTNASAKAPHTTVEASVAGLGSVTVAPSAGGSRLLLPYETLLGLLGRRARGILLDERAQRLARGAALPQLRLGASDVEQRVGRLGILGPELDHPLLGGDRGLVVAHGIVGVADPVLRRGHELAARETGHEVLEVGDRELVVAELELVERRLVRLLLRGCAALALAQFVLQLRLRLLESSQAVVQVDVEVFLPPFEGFRLVREHFDLPAQLGDVLLERIDQLGEIDGAVLPGGVHLRKARVDRRKAFLDRLLAALDLVPQLDDLPARLVVVEQGRVGEKGHEKRPEKNPPARQARAGLRQGTRPPPLVKEVRGGFPHGGYRSDPLAQYSPP